MTKIRGPLGQFVMSSYESKASLDFELLTVRLWWSPRQHVLIPKHAHELDSWSLPSGPLTFQWQSDEKTRREYAEGRIDGPYYGGGVIDAGLSFRACKTFDAFLRFWEVGGSSYTSADRLKVLLGNVVHIRLRPDANVYDVIERRTLEKTTPVV